MPSKARIKPCKAVPCLNPRYGSSSLCKTHHWEKVRAKKSEAKAKKLARKLNSKGYKEGERKRLHRKCWKLMSEWVRRKNADWRGNVKCWTCEKVLPWKEMDAGHHFHSRLDFDERNLRPQETKCNRFLHGNLAIYAKRLIQENGLEWYERLERDANSHKGYSLEDLKRIHAELQSKLTNLEG